MSVNRKTRLIIWTRPNLEFQAISSRHNSKLAQQPDVNSTVSQTANCIRNINRMSVFSGFDVTVYFTPARFRPKYQYTHVQQNRRNFIWDGFESCFVFSFEICDRLIYCTNTRYWTVYAKIRHSLWIQSLFGAVTQFLTNITSKSI